MLRRMIMLSGTMLLCSIVSAARMIMTHCIILYRMIVIFSISNRN